MESIFELWRIGMDCLLKRQLTIQKIISLFHNLMRGFFFRSSFVYGLPSVLVVEPTDVCNLKCLGCGFQQENGIDAIKRSFLSLDTYKKVIDDAKENALLLFPFMGGEPFLHPDIFEIIQYAEERKIATIISTNGNFSVENWEERLLDSGLDRIVFSISGTTQEVYKRYHKGGDLNLVFKNIEALVKEKRKRNVRFPRIYLRYLAFPENRVDKGNAKKISIKLGVDYLEIRQDNNWLFNEIDTIDQNKIYRGKNKIPNFCFWLWTTMVINSKGEVRPCCFEYFNIPKLGNVHQESIVKIWHSLQYNSFRKQILKNRKHLKSCVKCNTRIGFQGQAFLHDSKSGAIIDS